MGEPRAGPGSFGGPGLPNRWARMGSALRERLEGIEARPNAKYAAEYARRRAADPELEAEHREARARARKRGAGRRGVARAAPCARPAADARARSLSSESAGACRECKLEQHVYGLHDGLNQHAN